MLNVPLFKEDIDTFLTLNEIRGFHGEIMKLPTFKKVITDPRYNYNYTVQEKKVKGGKRYIIITK